MPTYKERMKRRRHQIKDPSKRELIKLCLKQWGIPELNRSFPFRKRIAMTLKTIIIIAFDYGFPTNTDTWEDESYYIAGFNCKAVNGCFDPEEIECAYLLVHDGWRNWYAGIQRNY